MDEYMKIAIKEAIKAKKKGDVPVKKKKKKMLQNMQKY